MNGMGELATAFGLVLGAVLVVVLAAGSAWLIWGGKGDDAHDNDDDL